MGQNGSPSGGPFAFSTADWRLRRVCAMVVGMSTPNLWVTVSGPRAFCECGWGYDGDSDPSALPAITAGRKHRRETGHAVHIERGQVLILDGEERR